MTREERVYLIGCPGAPLVKIGWTDNPESRLRHLRTGSPVPLQVLALFEGGAIVEAELHRRFADKRRHGEWSDLGPDPMTVVNRFVKVAQVKEARAPGAGGHCPSCATTTSPLRRCLSDAGRPSE